MEMEIILCGDESESILYFFFICVRVDKINEFQCNPQTLYCVALISTTTSDYKGKESHQ